MHCDMTVFNCDGAVVIADFTRRDCGGEGISADFMTNAFATPSLKHCRRKERRCDIAFCLCS
jgi:hypothetical protein